MIGGMISGKKVFSHCTIPIYVRVGYGFKSRFAAGMI